MLVNTAYPIWKTFNPPSWRIGLVDASGFLHLRSYLFEAWRNELDAYGMHTGYPLVM
jgi:hypothetical protein